MASGLAVTGFDYAAARQFVRHGQNGLVAPCDRPDALIDAATLLAEDPLLCAQLRLGARTIPLDQPQVMAILNITPDSFSDGGQHVGDPAGAASAGMKMLEAGAALLDIGGE